MSRFATMKAAKAGRSARPDTVNASGGEAHEQSARLALGSLVLTSMLSSRSTETPAKDMERVRGLVQTLAAQGDLLYAAKAAIYARKVHGMRSITHVLAGEIAAAKGEFPWRRKFFTAIVDRADDAAEILSYYIAAHLGERKRWTLPNALKRGIAKALLGFDAYRLAKYQGNGKAMSLVDVVNLVHPKAPADHPIHALMQGKLASADTWEAALSKAGNSEDADSAKADEWKRLLAEKKLGYLAALRNVRNIIEQAPACIEDLCSLLTNRDLIAKARIFPFQFNAARKAVMELPGDEAKLAVRALNRALDASVENVPEFGGRTCVVVDESGSMGGMEHGSVFSIASLFAAIICKRNPLADLIGFSNDARYVGVDTEGSVLSIQEAINARRVNGGTNFHSVFQTMRKSYDRIFILSDMQAWMGYNTPAAAFADYQRRHGCHPFVYAFDLTGSGTMQFPEHKVCALAGWSDKIFTVIENLEQDPKALVAAIDQTELP